MTISMIRPKEFLSPTVEPIKGTLLDAATEIPGGYPSQNNVGMFQTLACIATDSTPVAPCPAAYLAAPVQSAASTATTGGTLAAGAYKAVVTAVNNRGETVASNEVTVTTTGATSTATFNWAAVTGATQYRVYVSAVGGGAGSETLLTTVNAPAVTYVWTGTPARGTATPPTVNTAVVNVPKTFSAPSWQDGFQFAVYAGVICKMVGFDATSAEADLERVFSNKESVAVARALMKNRFVSGGSLNWAAPADLTPAAGAVDPVVGLAILEGHASWNYAGQPTLHVPRTIGSLLLNKYAAIHYDGNTLRTELGAKVAADGGYESPNQGPTGAAPSAGELWLYASGEVTFAAADAKTQSGLDLVETTDSNRYRILRERAYIASVDCYTAAVRVKVQ